MAKSNESHFLNQDNVANTKNKKVPLQTVSHF